MTAHTSDDLPMLLTGEANRDVVMAAAAHLRVCEDCRQELVSAVVAHASLTSAHRFAPEIVAAADLDDLAATSEVTPAELPDLSAVFADARAEAAAPRRPATRTRLRIAAVAAAAAVVIGGGVTYAVVNSADSGPSTRTVALEPYGQGDDPAKVTIVGDSTLRVDATKLPKLDDKHRYEVWLTDDARKSMQSAGFIGDENKAELTISRRSMSRYDNFEISVQRVNENQYSGISVLRGTYA